MWSVYFDTAVVDLDSSEQTFFGGKIAIADFWEIREILGSFFSPLIDLRSACTRSFVLAPILHKIAT